MTTPTSGAPAARPPVKCVVWDLDRTLLQGVWLEADEASPPVAVPDLLAAAVELERRGILNAVASRNPPQAWGELSAALAPVTFAAVELGWDAKSVSLTRIAERLGFGTDALAFVDDDPYERAEVGFALPEVLVLSPEQLAESLDAPELSPGPVTAEAARRAELYRAREAREQGRRAAERSGRPVAEFLAEIGTEITVRPAGPADVERLHELSVRTHRFNSTGEVLDAGGWRALLADPGHRVLVVALRDRFGDDGLVGGCLLDTEAGSDSGPGPGPAWTVRLLMMSCRAMGRGVIERQLAAALAEAAAGGAELLRLPCRLTDRNVPLRLALRAADFAPEGDPDVGGVTIFTHPVDRAARPPARRPVSAGPGPAPSGPSSAPVAEAREPFVAELAGVLAELTGRPELAGLGPDAALLGGEVGLDSLRGTLLLATVRQRYGVDVADLDVNLDSLATLGTLARFVSTHR